MSQTPVLLFLAEGFEEIEALSVVDILRRAQISVQTVSVSEDLTVKGAHGIPVVADALLSDLPADIQSPALVLPGGMPGAANLAASPQLAELLQQQNRRKGLLAAICAAPTVLSAAGVGNPSLHATAYPGFEDQVKTFAVVPEPLVEADNFITAQGPAYAMAFGLAIVSALAGPTTAQQVQDGLLYKGL